MHINKPEQYFTNNPQQSLFTTSSVKTLAQRITTFFFGWTFWINNSTKYLNESACLEAWSTGQGLQIKNVCTLKQQSFNKSNFKVEDILTWKLIRNEFLWNANQFRVAHTHTGSSCITNPSLKCEGWYYAVKMWRKEIVLRVHALKLVVGLHGGWLSWAEC